MDGFHEFSWMDFHPIGVALNSPHSQKWIQRKQEI
jgi:hypothetical protein